MNLLSTEDVAKKSGISRVTLERWLAAGKVPAPNPIQVGRSVFRAWTKRDVERVKRHKARFYRTGRGRKKKDELRTDAPR
jgi:predicted DNA-binding transcriptional regulator AlpA